MLNDSLFKSLEQSTFKNLFRLNDTDFISAVWSYAKNHEDEQGILNMAASNKINSAIFGEIPSRIDGLTEEDLGLLMRSLQKLPLTQLPS